MPSPGPQGAEPNRDSGRHVGDTTFDHPQLLRSTYLNCNRRKEPALMMLLSSVAHCRHRGEDEREHGEDEGLNDPYEQFQAQERYYTN